MVTGIATSKPTRGGTLANTSYWIDPARRLTGLLLTQLLPFGDPGVLDLFAGFERAVYAGRA